MARFPVVQPGSAKVHFGRITGIYESGTRRFEKLCGTARTDRYFPSLAPGAVVDCKRCLAAAARLDATLKGGRS